jgi:hypothetical protein
MMILRVDLEVFRQVINALAQERDLYFGRPGVSVVCLEVADDSCLAVFRESHDSSSTNGPGTRALAPHRAAVLFLNLLN